MVLIYNKTSISQKRSSIFVALALIVFLLFSFSVTFADVSSVDQELVNQTHNEVLDQNQSTIKSHLGLYLEKFSSKDPEFVKRFQGNTGLCNGLTILWLYSKWLDTQPEKANGYNSNWVKSTGEAIVTWNGEEKPQDEIASNFEAFATLIDFFQSPEAHYQGMPQNDLEDMISLSKLDTNGKAFEKVYTATAVFNELELYDFLKNTVYDDELVHISYKGKEGYHAVGLFKHEGNYYYYDSNHGSGETQTTSIEEIAGIIFASSKCNDGKDYPIAFEVYSFDEKSPLRPNQIDSSTASTKTHSYVTAKTLLGSEHIGALEQLAYRGFEAPPYGANLYGVIPAVKSLCDKMAKDIASINAAIDLMMKGGCKDCLITLKNNIPKKANTKPEDTQNENFREKFLDESSKKLAEVFGEDPEKLKDFHGGAYADIAEKAIEKFKQAMTTTKGIASASVSAYLEFQNSVYNQFLQVAESEMGKEAGRRAADAVWYLVDATNTGFKMGADPEVVGSFVKGFTTCEGGCVVIGGTIGAAGGTAAAPGVGAVGGALAGGFSGATLCLPGCFCVGLVNGALKAIDINDKNVYFREGSENGAGKTQGGGKEVENVNVDETANKIANGHAFDKHIGDFPGLKTKGDLAGHVKKVMLDKGSVFKKLKDGRSAYWHEESKTVVIHDPKHVDGGSVFKSSKRYFEGIE